MSTEKETTGQPQSNQENVEVDKTTKPMKAVKRRKRLHPKVFQSCQHCKLSHARCSNYRPCERCTSKGIICYDLPVKKAFYETVDLYHEFQLNNNQNQNQNQNNSDFNQEQPYNDNDSQAKQSQTFINTNNLTQISNHNFDELQQLKIQAFSQYQLIQNITKVLYERRVLLLKSPKTILDRMCLNIVASMSHPIVIWDKYSLLTLYCNSAFEKLFHNSSANYTQGELFDHREKNKSVLDMIPPVFRQSLKIVKEAEKNLKGQVSVVRARRAVMIDSYGRLIVGINTVHLGEDFCWTEYHQEGYLIPIEKEEKEDNPTMFKFKPLLPTGQIQNPFIFDDSFELDGVVFPSRISAPDIRVVIAKLERAANIISSYC